MSESVSGNTTMTSDLEIGSSNKLTTITDASKRTRPLSNKSSDDYDDEDSNNNDVEKGRQVGASTTTKKNDNNDNKNNNDDGDNDDDCNSTISHHTNASRLGRSKWVVTCLIVLLGAGACASFFSFGITTVTSESKNRFESDGEAIANHIRNSWQTYETFGLWIHESCHHHVEPNSAIDPYDDIAGHLGYCSRKDFRKLYEYIQSQGVDFASAQFLKNITHTVRDAVEAEAKAYYDEYHPHVNYVGVTEWVPKQDGNGFDIVPRPETEYYLPVHYVEPVEGNEAVIDLDKLTSLGKDEALEAMRTLKPVLTSRLKLVQETDTAAYGVILVHPGTLTSIENVQETNSVAQIVIRMPFFLEYALRASQEVASVYLFDSTDKSQPPQFLGGVMSQKIAADDSSGAEEYQFTSLHETSLYNVTHYGPGAERHFLQDFELNGRSWTMVMHSTKNQPEFLFVILGGSIIFAASICFGCWFHTHLSRVAKINELKSAAQAEKAQNARVQALKERELNEFIAHEVRNPLASAISALSFVSTGVADHVPNPDYRQAIMDDVAIMEASLQFINELLRNMLDVHRTKSHQITLQISTVDVRQDILDPIAAILFMRGAKVEIIVDCPNDLFVKADRMRLKQVLLNLSANATKFVNQGFIRLKAAVIDEGNSVELSVEDSGPGIPAEKRVRLFAKFQESLDSLNQGTGIGLCICKNLSELMGADLGLDEEFRSGVPGCPGTRFFLNLNEPPIIEHEDITEQDDLRLLALSNNNNDNGDESEKIKKDGTSPVPRTMIVPGASAPTLPESMSVLIVDDDTMIRKMLKRAILRVAPGWAVEEASNGETALRVVETKDFDLIFLDQYMASIEKQLLGTETARALRSKGVTSFITGFSANNMEQPFIEAGADFFMFKPFPCKSGELTAALLTILEMKKHKESQ